MKRYNGARFTAVRRPAVLAFAAVTAVTTIAACSSSSSSSSSSAAASSAAASSSSAPASTSASGGAIKKGLVVYFIPKDTQNPYEVLADAGGAKALAELGGKVVVSSGTADTAAAQSAPPSRRLSRHTPTRS